MRKTVAVSFAIALCVVSLRSCSFSGNTTREKQLYEGLSRNEILNKCISCHPGQHEDEKIGPHPSSYFSLKRHADYVNNPHYHEKVYTSFVNNKMEITCLRCHAPDNMFETNLKGLEYVKSIDSINIENYPRLFDYPPPRKDRSTFHSGVDCVTCHYNGTHVVTGTGFVEDENDRKMIDYCFPVSSVFLNSNIFCANCHTESYDDLKRNAEANLISQEFSCNNCHLEKLNGKKSHYYFWKNDPEYKVSDKYTNAIFKGLTASLSIDTVKIAWRNSGIPHVLNDSREIIAMVEILDANGKIAATDSLRINRKTIHDERMVAEFGSYILPGKAGLAFHPAGPAIEKSIILRAHVKQPLMLRVSILNKSSYWLSDTLAVPLTIKEILLPSGEATVL